VTNDEPKARTATVFLERAGLSIRLEDVPADDVAEAAAGLLDAFRLLRQAYPEVVADLGSVHGGYPVEVVEDDWSEEGRGRVGFTTR
jgi:hypothetical protein